MIGSVVARQRVVRWGDVFWRISFRSALRLQNVEFFLDDVGKICCANICRVDEKRAKCLKISENAL